ncbi:MAG: LptA/OstA family protein [Pseudomonadota bacterium]
MAHRRGRATKALAIAAGIALGMAGGLTWSGSALAQGQAFTGLQHNTDLPVDIEADSLEVRDSEKIAIFRGGAQPVKVSQGEARLFAQELRVSYSGGGGGGGGIDGPIERIQAKGQVFISNGSEHAEADQADYNLVRGEIVMTGNVTLLQQENILTGNRLRIDLNSGQAKIEGGVSATRGSDGRVKVKLVPNAE